MRVTRICVPLKPFLAHTIKFRCAPAFVLHRPLRTFLGFLEIYQQMPRKHIHKVPWTYLLDYPLAIVMPYSEFGSLLIIKLLEPLKKRRHMVGSHYALALSQDDKI